MSDRPEPVPEGLERYVLAAIEAESYDEPSPLALHAEGALPPEEAARVDSLAAQHPVVAARVAALRDVLAAPVTLPALAFPPALRGFVLEAVRTTPAVRPRASALMRVAAALLVGVGLGLLAGRLASDSPGIAPDLAPELRARVANLTRERERLRVELAHVLDEAGEARAHADAREDALAGANDARATAELERDRLGAELVGLRAELALALARAPSPPARTVEATAVPTETLDARVARASGVVCWDATNLAWRTVEPGQRLGRGSVVRAERQRGELRFEAPGVRHAVLGPGLYVIVGDRVDPVPERPGPSGAPPLDGSSSAIVEAAPSRTGPVDRLRAIFGLER